MALLVDGTVYTVVGSQDFIDLQIHTRHYDLPDLNAGGLTVAREYLQADKVDYTGRFEHYEDEIVRILQSIIPNLITEDQIRVEIARAGLKNYTRDPDGGHRRPFQTYYDTRMRNAVAEMEADLIERFGYSFDDEDRILGQQKAGLLP